jgi:hypothetical protein
MFRFSYFSWIRSVLFSFMSGSGLSDLWPHFFVLCPAPVFRIYDPFEFRFVCFVSRSKVKKFDDQACPFFVHVRSFGSMTSPPPWTVYSDHSCPVSHHLVLFLFEFRLVCFVSRSKVKKIRWPSLSFFLSCPAPVFPIYAPPPPTPSVPFYLYCICEGGGGRGQGGPWPMGDSGSCSGVLKYAVTWYCISTFTSLHISVRGLEGWGGGGEWGNSYRMVRWGQRDEFEEK